jgi:phage N-6-adenine-methyltransferase
MKELLNTPAIVRPADALAELAGRINAEHSEALAAARASLTHARNAGQLLLEAKKQCGHGQWLPWLEANVRFSDRTANAYMRVAKRWADLEANPQATADLTIEDALGLLAQQDREDEDSQPTGTPAHSGDDGDSAALPHVARNTGDNEWYTPEIYIEAARRAMGEIDLEPASNAVAQETVGAATFYTKEDSGLDKPWRGRVWMNPPYAAGLVDEFIAKLCEHVQSGEVTSAVVLVNNATETRWFQEGMALASAVCFPRGRIRFISPDGELGTPLQGQAFLYFGPDAAAFSDEFGEFGPCLDVRGKGQRGNEVAAKAA